MVVMEVVQEASLRSCLHSRECTSEWEDRTVTKDTGKDPLISKLEENEPPWKCIHLLFLSFLEKHQLMSKGPLWQAQCFGVYRAESRTKPGSP